MIRIAGEQFVLQDLDSKNGTWKNDAPVREAVELIDGDRIRIGGVPLTFRSTAQAESTATIGD